MGKKNYIGAMRHKDRTSVTIGALAQYLFGAGILVESCSPL